MSAAMEWAEHIDRQSWDWADLLLTGACLVGATAFGTLFYLVARGGP